MTAASPLSQLLSDAGSPSPAPSPLLLAERAARGEAIPWSEALSVGIPSIDAQHRVLLAYLNQLSSAIARGQDAAVLAEVIAGLEGYTRLHFRHEERLFALHGWEEEAEHILEDDRAYSPHLRARGVR